MAGQRTTDDGGAGTTAGRRTAVACVGVAALVVALLAPPLAAAGASDAGRPAANDSTGNGTALVAPGALADHPDGTALLRDATGRSTVARGDVAVARFAVPGLDVYYDERRLRDELDADALSLAVARTDPNRSDGAGAWHSDAANVSVVPAPGNGTLYAFWRVPGDAPTGDYEVTLTEGGDATDGSRSVGVTFTVVEREVSFPYGEQAIFQPGPTVVYGNTTVAPGTTLALQARSPGERGFPVTETVQVASNGSFRIWMNFTATENGTAFTLSALGHSDSAVPGIIVGPGPDDLAPTATTSPSSTTAAPTTTGEATTTAVPATATETSTATDATTTGGQAGFGPAAGLLAVVVALALVGRRGSG